MKAAIKLTTGRYLAIFDKAGFVIALSGVA